MGLCAWFSVDLFWWIKQKHQTKKYSEVKHVDKLVQEDGTIDTYKLDTHNIDMVVAGRLLFDLYATTKMLNI
jgi:unsaturated rhamnogalacturonyl hydrolase